MFDELVKRCVDNKNYDALIVVKNKKDIDKIKINSDFIKKVIRLDNDVIGIYFLNGSIIRIYCQKDLDGVRCIRVSYLMIEKGIDNKFIEEQLFTYLRPYYHYMNGEDMNDMSYDESIVEYFELEDKMNKFEIIKKYIEEYNDCKSLTSVQKILNDWKKLFKDYDVELNKKYWVSEWSYNPTCDGIYEYEEIIRRKDDRFYYAYSNFRKYFIWDIWEDKEEAEYVSDFKNRFGYDWDMGEGIIKIIKSKI